MLSREPTNTNFMVFDLNRPALESRYTALEARTLTDEVSKTDTFPDRHGT
jgi:hypothetical protein